MAFVPVTTPLRRPCRANIRPRFHCTAAAAASRLILVPSPTRPPWYDWLAARLPNLHILDQMPDPYASNTKRWERVWLAAMRAAIADGRNVSLLGHAAGADACLRYLENYSVSGAVALVAPTADEYFAAERHARPYHWQCIRDNVGGSFALAWSHAVTEPDEIDHLIAQLKPVVSTALSSENGAYLHASEAHDVLALVTATHVINDDSMRNPFST